MKTRIIITESLDPWQNLAMEEYLLGDVRPGECILYLWQNQNTVVIGKNQNPWRECKTQLLEAEGGRLARRSSGGGAVFHDLGNLNFSFLIDRRFYDVTKQLRVILDAVAAVGIHAVFSGRNDLTVQGRKFSGNAFSFKKDSALHHGTILVSADMDKMTRYLQVNKDKIKTKGIESVKSRVVNLSAYDKSLTIPKMRDCIIGSFKNLYGTDGELWHNEADVDQGRLNELNRKYKSWEWRYGESPKFDIELGTRFTWGDILLGLRLEKGRIIKVHAYSDAMDEELIGMLPQIIKGRLFESEDISNALLGLEVDADRKGILEDISRWVLDKGI